MRVAGLLLLLAGIVALTLLPAGANGSISSLVDASIRFAATGLGPRTQYRLKREIESPLVTLCGVASVHKGAKESSMCAALYVEEGPALAANSCQSEIQEEDLLALFSASRVKRELSPLEQIEEATSVAKKRQLPSQFYQYPVGAKVADYAGYDQTNAATNPDCIEDLKSYRCFIAVTGTVLRGEVGSVSKDVLKAYPGNLQSDIDVYLNEYFELETQVHDFYAQRLPVLMATNQVHLLQKAAMVYTADDLEVGTKVTIDPQTEVATNAQKVYIGKRSMESQSDRMKEMARENLRSLCSCVCGSQ